jgi:hypothetical protein
LLGEHLPSKSSGDMSKIESIIVLLDGANDGAIDGYDDFVGCAVTRPISSSVIVL